MHRRLVPWADVYLRDEEEIMQDTQALQQELEQQEQVTPEYALLSMLGKPNSSTGF